MTNKKIVVGVVQQRCIGNVEYNLSQSIAAIKKAVMGGANLILLQELHTNLYFCQREDAQLFDLAETIPGPSTKQLSAIAKELKIILVASLFEKRAPGLYHNTAVVFEETGAIAGIYRKMHIPDDPAFYEKFYFTPGDYNSLHGFEPIQTSLGKLGVLVCWDQWYPEAARLMALAGADLLLYPTAIGWGTQEIAAEKKRQLDAWQCIQQSHAIANALPVVVANRVGFESVNNDTVGIAFWGNSFIAGPQGEILMQAGQDETILVCEIDTQRTETVRRSWPFLRDRRIDAYGDLLKRYRDNHQ